MNTIKPFNRSRCQFIRHLKTVQSLDARILSLELGRIVQPSEIVDLFIGEDSYSWMLRSGERVFLIKEQLYQYLQDLAEL